MCSCCSCSDFTNPILVLNPIARLRGMLRISLFGERHLKSKCCCLNRHISATKSSISPCRRDEGIFKPRIDLQFVESGNAAEHSVFVQCRGSDHYVVRIDGRVKSHHRRFVDALRDGLFVRDQFPQHDVKVHAMHERSGRRTVLH